MLCPHPIFILSHNCLYVLRRKRKESKAVNALEVADLKVYSCLLYLPKNKLCVNKMLTLDFVMNFGQVNWGRIRRKLQINVACKKQFHNIECSTIPITNMKIN